MRASLEQLNALAAAITPIDTGERRQRYREGRFPNAALVNNLNARYRWDLFWEVRPTLATNLQDLNDNHLDTVLRRIVPMLEDPGVG